MRFLERVERGTVMRILKIENGYTVITGLAYTF